VLRCRRGELFDYLTEVVTLNETRTRFVYFAVLLHLGIDPGSLIRKACTSEWCRKRSLGVL